MFCISFPGVQYVHAEHSASVQNNLIFTSSEYTSKNNIFAMESQKSMKPFAICVSFFFSVGKCE